MNATANESEIVAFTLCKGDILITKDSEDWNDIAVPALVTQNLDGVLCGYHLALIRPHQNQVSGEYLFRSFSAPSVAKQFSLAATGVTRYGLSKHAIKAGIFPVPPLDEQQRICAYIAHELLPITSSVDRIQREIYLIREYRTRLIADVVTGKLDVRGVELPALDEADDLASLDGEVADDMMVDGDELELMEEGVDAGN